MFSFFKRKQELKKEEHPEELESTVKPNIQTDSKSPSTSKLIDSFVIYEDDHFKFYVYNNRTYLEIDKKLYSVGCKHPYDPISYISDDHGMTKLFRPGWYFNKNEMSCLLDNGTIGSITGRNLSAYDMCHLLETIVNSGSDDLDIGEMERKTFN